MSDRERLLLDRLREATLALRDVVNERDALLRARHEPIAIIGISCRLPGGADDPARLWALLDAGRDAITSLEPRWALTGARPGEAAPRWAGLLTGAVDEFDPGFFGIAPREAQTLDPQHRVLLELGWEALEDACVPVHALKDSKTGVFIGATNTDYARLVARLPPEEQDAYTITGNLLSVAAGRLAYTWGLRGPCVTVDTVCSSSLVTVHLACQSLRAGECGLAIAGGVNLILSAEAMEGVQRTQALAPDGRCKTFDARANGFARGEGAGLVVLKRLRDALRDGDPIRALIRGSAVNQDGASAGLTAPSRSAQEAMLRDALASARASAEDIGYVETHGTGTSLGDPIEVEALRAVLGDPRPDGRPCVLGAIKTNIGHLEAAAGVAGLIKTALILERGRIPKNLNFTTLNPRIELERSALELATAARDWPRGATPRLAGVSSFGLSGTNAHVILEEAPPRRAPPTPALESTAEPALFVLSAKTPAALAELCGRLRDQLRAQAHPLGDIAYSLATARSPLARRLAIVASSREELTSVLERAAEGETPAGSARGRVRRARPALALLFTGQGSQRLGMGRELHARWPCFRDAFDRCAALFDRALDRPLTAIMWAEPGGPDAHLLDQTQYTQPALFALQYALAALWRAWGVEPVALAGHSVGELAAACVAGVFSLEDAARLVSARARLMQALPAGGAMTVLEAPEDEVRRAVAQRDRVDIAAVNAPAQVVISGARADVDAVAAGFSNARALTVSHAFHSPLMEPMLEAFTRVARGVTYHPPARPLVSCLSGALAGEEVARAEYWIRHVREAVRFADAVTTMHELGARAFLELGPRPALLGNVARCLPAADPTLIASLRSKHGERRSALEALARAWATGCALDWGGVFPGGGRRVRLPRYPWQRARCWIPLAEASASAPPRAEVGAYYDAVAQAAEGDGDEERYLTFAPFHQPVPGFSWLLATIEPARHPEQARRVLAAQREMREVLFRHVDLESCRDALDIGCGYGTDLARLAAQHPRLRLHGHTVSEEQVRVARARLDKQGVGERAQVLLRDSAAQPFTADYDLVFGVEVACHIRDKAALFANVGARLREGGALVLSDFVSNLREDIIHEDTSSFLVTAARWAETLARNGLRLVDCVDVSPEIANFLDDPDYEQNLQRLQERRETAGIRDALGSYDQLGELLRRRMVSYALMTARRAPAGADEADLVRDNLRALDERRAYTSCLRGHQALDDSPFLRVTWRSRPLSEDAAAESPPARWLILGDDVRGDALASALEGRGHAVARAPAPPDAGAAETTLRQAFSLQPPSAVVLLCEDAREDPAALDDDALARSLSRGAEQTLALTQALARAPWRDAPRLWLVTRGAQATHQRPRARVSLSQAPILGLARVIAMEHPEFRCARVDIDPSWPEEHIEPLLAELLADDAEDEVALRGEARLVARVERVEPPAREAPFTAREDGVYLITGGLGGLGLRVAAWLVERGATRLLLLGRRGAASESQRAAVADLVARGAEVRVLAADVSRRDELARALASLDPKTPLRGVVHAAGVADPCMLAELTPARLRAVMAPKALGAAHLDALTRDYALDLFVLYASMSGLLGLAGTGNYAAANALLDALAHDRRARGRAGLSVDWGVFAGVGLAAARDDRERARYSAGMRGMSSEEGLDALERALASDEAQLGVAPLDAAQWVESYPAAASSRRVAPLLRVTPDRAPRGAAILERLRGASPDERARLVLTTVRAQAAQVLRVPEDELDLEEPLTSLGMDSLMGLELRNRIETALGLKVAPTLLWTYPTVLALSHHLAGELGEPTRDDAERHEPSPDDLDDLSDLSDEDSARLIDEEFDALL